MRKVLMLAAVGVLFSGLSLLKADDKGAKITITGDGLCTSALSKSNRSAKTS